MCNFQNRTNLEAGISRTPSASAKNRKMKWASVVGTGISVGSAIGSCLAFVKVRQDLTADAYTKWKLQRTKIFGDPALCNKKDSPVQNALNVATVYKKAYDSTDPAAMARWTLIEESRLLGRHVLELHQDWLTRLLLRDVLKKHRYAELLNVTIATSPLEAVNGEKYLKPEQKAVPLDNFGAVLCTNLALTDSLSFYVLDLVPKHEEAFGEVTYAEWRQQVEQFLVSPAANTFDAKVQSEAANKIKT